MKTAITILSSTLLLATAAATAAPERGSDARATERTPVKGQRELPRNESFTAIHGMAALMGTDPPPACADPGANPLASLPLYDGTGGVACAAGGITTENNYAVVFTQADLGGAYSFSCLNIGATNSGSPVNCNVSVQIDEDGGDPSVSGMTLVQAFPLVLGTGSEQQISLTGEEMCIELTGNQTLVVTFSLEASNDGFATFSGGTTGATTYVATAACGLNDFLPLDAIGFPSNKWWVELSGDFGCAGTIPGDLNDDGLVNGSDLAILLGAWGTADPIADLCEDGLVDGCDLSVVLGNWTG